MNGGFGPGLGISSSPLTGGGYSHSTNRLAIHRSHTSSHGSHHSDRIQPHPSHYGHPRPNTRPGPVGTITPVKGKWMIPICHEPENDTKTCCLGFWCPQILYGRTQFRLRQMAQSKDPLDLTDYKAINGPYASFMLVGYCYHFSCKLRVLILDRSVWNPKFPFLGSHWLINMELRDIYYATALSHSCYIRH
jgi:hypothetical protein